MSRRSLTLILLGGAAVPLIAAVAIFGCCVLPFHHLLHGAMPLCHSAARLLAHQAGDRGATTTAAVPRAPNPGARGGAVVSRSRQAPAVPQSAHLVQAAVQLRCARSAIALGALRVDDDVGLSTLFRSLLI